MLWEIGKNCAVHNFKLYGELVFKPTRFQVYFEVLGDLKYISGDLKYLE